MMKTHKRILFLLPTTGFGGAELHTLTLAKHFSDLGNDVTMAFPHTGGTAQLFQLCSDQGVKTADMPLAQLLMATATENYKEQSKRLLNRIAQADYDAVVVAAPSPMTAVGLLKALSELEIPGFCIFHLVAENLVIPEAARLEMLKALRANFRFVGVSEFTRDMLCAALDLSPDDGFVDFIPNGSSVQLASTPFDFSEHFVNENTIPIATVGRIHPQKGGIFLVEALPKVLQSFPEARFLWFGDGPQKRELLKVAKDLGVAHALFFPGYTEKPAEIMRAAELVVLPTLYEGLSLTLLEALHSGAAIVTTDASYQDRILKDGQNAGIVPCRDPEALADKIVQYLSDPELRETIKSNAKSLSEYYSESRMLRDYSLLLDELCGYTPTLRQAKRRERQKAAWFRLKEASNGAISIEVRHETTEVDTGQRKSISLDDLSASPSSVLKGANLFGIELEFPGRIEVWLPLQTCRGMLMDDISIGGFLLNATQSDTSFQTSRSYVLLNVAIEKMVSTITPGQQLRSGDLAAIVNFRERFDLPGLQLLFRLLNLVSDVETRHQCILELGKYCNYSELTIRNIGIASNNITKGEIALLKGVSAQASGKFIEAKRYLTIYESLGGRRILATEKPKVVFFAEYFNYPPLNGGDRRMLSLIQAYQKLGFSVVFCGTCPARLSGEKEKQAQTMQTALGVDAHYIILSEQIAAQMKNSHNKLNIGENAIDEFYSMPVLAEMRRLVAALQPSILHVNYCYFGWIGAAAEGLDCHRVLDTHDLISRRVAMNKEMLRVVGGRRPQSIKQVSRMAHDASRFAALRYNLLPEELLQLAQFDTVLMISPDEASFLAPRMATDSVRTLEMFSVYAPAQKLLKESSKIRAVFAGGNNIYNFLGAAAIQNHILPYMESHIQNPNAFSMRVVGDVGLSMTEGPLLEITGRLPDVEIGYFDVDFAICPIPAGTGQNVKIIEALSRGLPVLAYGDIGRTANVIHGVNGLLANSVQSLRRNVLDLIEDDAKRNALTQSTKDWAAKHFNQIDFENALWKALKTTGFQGNRNGRDTQ